VGSLSGSDSDLLKNLQVELTKRQEVLMANPAALDAVLNQFDFQKHSLGALHVLAVIAVMKAKQDPVTFVNAAIRFLDKCSPVQIRFDPKKFKFVCETLTALAVDNKVAIRILKPLKAAIWKIGGDGSNQITPQHAFLMQAVIKSKCYKFALPILEHFVYEIDVDRTAVDSEHTRLYFYYGGIIYLALKRYAKALECFELVVSAPAIVGSAIMLAAYKKFILTSLIMRGDASTLPKYTNPSLVRVFKQLSTPYEEFATSFSTRSVDDLHKVATNYAAKYIEDGNMGLVKQAIQAMVEQNIQRLTKTYITLSLNDIAQQVNLANAAEVEKRVLKMIQNEKVFAEINQQDGMVKFKSNPNQYDTARTLDYLDKQLDGTITLNKEVDHTEESISTSVKYLQKVLQAERAPSRVDPMDVATPGSPGDMMGGFKG
jgi:COP9 signalosome complex subunit 3